MRSTRKDRPRRISQKPAPPFNTCPKDPINKMTGFKRKILSAEDMECYPTKMWRCFYWGLNLVVVPQKRRPESRQRRCSTNQHLQRAFLRHFANDCDNESCAAQATIAAATMARPTTAVRIAEAVRPPPLDHVMRLSVCLGCG